MSITFGLGPETAAALDAADPLASIRSRFRIPRAADGTDQIYLVGNSLGAIPRATIEHVDQELERWANLGVAGHFTGPTAWVSYHELLSAQMARIVGAKAEEVVVMNSLTVNLHLLLMSFYTPTIQRHKILIEEHAFPSDHFAVESQIRQRGFDPAESLVVVSPRTGTDTLHPDDILDAIAHHGDQLAVVLLPGVQYFTGQALPMVDVTRAAHATGARVGFDLAHAAGNIELNLHEWGVDFAMWCGYKYLNGGPGGVGAAYVHERHITDPALPKLLGWWGTRKDTRFEMATVFEAIPTVESWQVSNAPTLSMAALKASLDVIDEAGGIGPLRAKSEIQIAYLDYLLDSILATRIECLTPRELNARGCQFALRVTDPRVDGRHIFKLLEEADVACDWRHPNVIRAAPVPLYNSFTDIYRFVMILDGLLTTAGAR